jgi:hypothetical protein
VFSRTSLSSSRVVANAREDSRKAEAMVRSDAVKASCSVRLCVRRASLVVGMWEDPVVVANVSSSGSTVAWFRFRRVDGGSGGLL